MAIHIPPLAWSPRALEFLTQCYLFVARRWQHCARESLPDQGFELRFREHCITNLPGWRISGAREMRLGSDRQTASGVLHEIDIAAQHEGITGIAELKNHQGSPDKNQVIVFHAKVVDFLAASAELALHDLCLTFMTSLNFEDPTLAACVGLGIHPISPQLRPIPVLANNAMIWSRKIGEGFRPTEQSRSKFDDYCARLNRIMIALQETWPSSRYGHLSPSSLVIHAVAFAESYEIAGELRQVNADCSELFKIFSAPQDSIEL